MGYYRSFCRIFSIIVQPLTNLVSPKSVYEWSRECQNTSLTALKPSAPVLTAPDIAHPFKLEVDASAIGAGAVLLQEDSSGVDHPVSY